MAPAGFSGALDIPSALGGAGVMSIGEMVFRDNNDLTSVTIPDSVTSIGEEAFSGCASLKIGTLPAGVTRIGEATFKNFEKLKGIYFDGNAPTTGADIFISCSPDLTIHFLSANTGFTDPWNGYPAVPK